MRMFELFEMARPNPFIDRYNQQLVSAYKEETNQEQDARYIIKLLKQADPSTNGTFMEWIIQKYIDGQFTTDQVNEINDALSVFLRVRQKLNANITKYQTLDQLYAVITPFQTNSDTLSKKALSRSGDKRGINSSEVKQFLENNSAKIFYKGNTVNVIVPLTAEAACILTNNSKMCNSINPNDSSIKRNIYVVHCKDGNKYAFHFKSPGSYQFEDLLRNDSLSGYELKNLVERNPELISAFNYVAAKYRCLALMDQNPELCMRLVRSNPELLSQVHSEIMSEEICLAAVEENGKALFYVPLEYQTEEVCLAAVDNDWDALSYIRDKNTKVLIKRQLGA